ncbi:hypothetical protein L210DRAFT_3760768 [Boletus edulis BED1]|uniref:Uncharacterized protein n=1 Tax=Boletus edulis BED1 TaxID=1328754 RepID=A0AAD4GEC4_BOLED|nr:hypothetical protein L210DRAFT_3760768 [Boletus edulis BED1]
MNTNPRVAQTETGPHFHYRNTSPSVFPNTCLLSSTPSGTLNQLEKTEDIPTVIGSAEQPSATARDDESDEIDDPDSFESIARSLEERSQLDDARGSQDFTPPFEKKRLFDFSNMTWLEITSRTSMKSLGDELELYELVDKDAEGEADDGDIVNDRFLDSFLHFETHLLGRRCVNVCQLKPSFNVGIVRLSSTLSVMTRPRDEKNIGPFKIVIRRFHVALEKKKCASNSLTLA